MKVVGTIIYISLLNYTFGLRARCLLDIATPESNWQSTGQPKPRVAESATMLEINSKAYPELYFQQSINHVDSETFSQRYFYTDEYYQPGGPAFLYIGGEGELNDRALKSGQVQVLAQRFQGSIYSVEHRYYGKSQLYQDLALSNLKYLSSKYAIKDLSNFILKNRKQGQKFIVIGGSYAGSLAAWVRKLYPDVIYGAIASSAPVLALDNFYQYDQAVGEALGSSCSEKMSQVIQYIDQKLDQGDNSVKSLFNCAEVEDISFTSVLSDIVATAVQYNRIGINYNIDTVCNGFGNLPLEQALTHLANSTKFYLRSQKKTCNQLTGLDDIRNLNIVKSVGTRQWTYQTCQEFGYWQTAPPPNYRSMRSKRLTLNWVYSSSCSYLNYGKMQGPPAVTETNRYYGGKSGMIERTIFINGGIDPWSALSITEDTGVDGVDVIFIPSGSHTQDLLATTNYDPEDLKQARARVVDIVESWLA